MSKAVRYFHMFAIGVHVAAICLFSWVYSVLQSPGWLFFIGWCVFYGAQSTLALRKAKTGMQV